MAEPGSGVRDGMTSAFAHRIWPADSRSLPAIRAELHGWLAALSLDEDDEDDLVLAVNEAASNSIEHAYTPPTADDTVELTFWTEPHAICVDIVDHGQWRTPSDQPTGRGRGIEIMQRLVGFVLIRHDNRGTRVHFRHPFPDAHSRHVAPRVPHLVPLTP